MNFWAGIAIGIVLTALLATIKGKLGDLFNAGFDWVLNRLRFKKSLYKKKIRDYFDKLEEILEDEKEFKEKSPKIDFSKELDSEAEWHIIKIEPKISKDRIEKSVIMQLPRVSKFSLERNLMTLPYKQALYLLLSKMLAEKLQKHDLVNFINDEIERKGILKEAQIMEELLKNKTKRFAMLEEARRKWKYLEEEGIGGTARREYCKFLYDLQRGKISVIKIWQNRPVEELLFSTKQALKKSDIIHVYARGGTHLKNLNKLERVVKSKIPKITVTKEIYDWEIPEGKSQYKAGTLIIIKKA